MRSDSNRVVATLRLIWLDVLALLWPCACLVCGVPNRELCTTCITALRENVGRAARVQPPAGSEVWAFGAYQGALRALLVGFKHHGRMQIARVLGELLSGPLQAALRARDGPLPVPTSELTPGTAGLTQGLTPVLTPGTAVVTGQISKPILIVTAPSRPAKVRERGFRPVDMLVRLALAHLRASGDPRAYLVPGALHTLPGRTGQVGLQTSQRERNAALIRVPRRMRGRLHGREVVLVDDIVTTGVTLQAAERALAEAGAQVVGIVVLGVTLRRNGGQQRNRLLREIAPIDRD